MPKPGGGKRRGPRMPNAAKVFMSLVEAASYKQGPKPTSVPLTNFTVWAGAGFSKAWGASAPLGGELFTLDADSLDRVADSMVLHRMLGLDGGTVTPDDLRQLVYQLDMYERYPDVCSRYVDPQNIGMMRAGLRSAVVQRYAEIADLNHLPPDEVKFPWASPTDAQRSIVGLFRHLLDSADGSQGHVEGVRCHFATTNYDFVIETILDQVLNPDDSLFIYTYRGFTPSHVSGFGRPVTTHQHWLSWHLLKLNGGFEILRENGTYVLDYTRRTADQIRDNPPILMLPSREQDYSDHYFRTIFPKAVRLMRDTQVLLIVGYSLPDDDALMRFILRQFAEEPEDGRGKFIIYVDMMPRLAKMARLKEVFPSIDQTSSPTVVTYEGSFADFATECMGLIAPSRPDPDV